MISVTRLAAISASAAVLAMPSLAHSQSPQPPSPPQGRYAFAMHGELDVGFPGTVVFGGIIEFKAGSTVAGTCTVNYKGPTAPSPPVSLAGAFTWLPGEQAGTIKFSSACSSGGTAVLSYFAADGKKMLYLVQTDPGRRAVGTATLQ